MQPLNFIRGLFQRTPSANPAVEEQPDETGAAQPEDHPEGEQIIFSESELTALGDRIQRDMDNSLAANQRRKVKFRELFRSWRDPEGMPGGSLGKPNFLFPLIQGSVYSRMAAEVQNLFGEDAAIAAEPTRPTDQERVEKIGAYASWVAFTAMDLIRSWTLFSFRRLFFGRSHAMLTYEEFYYNHPQKGRVLYRHAPKFTPIDPEDVFTPGEDVESAQEMSFFVRRFYETPDGLRLGEIERGHYQGIVKNWEAIRQAARTSSERDDDRGAGMGMKDDTDKAEGVNRRDQGFGTREILEVWEWYGRWRMLKTSTEQQEPATGVAGDLGGEAAVSFSPTSASVQATPTRHPSISPIPGAGTMPQPAADVEIPVDESALDVREEFETDLVVRYLPIISKVIGIQKLDELYPDTPNKRPIYEAGFGMPDGSYWQIGAAELLIQCEKELTINQNLMTQGGQYSVGPLIFYRPASGASPDVLRYEPGIMIPSDQPGKDVNAVQITFNPQFCVLNQQNVLAIVERIFGQSDFSVGRGIDRPTAPRTARGTIALLERGDVRVALDTTFLLLDFQNLLKRIWELCCMYAPEEQFFRVTGDNAEGLFETDRGFAKITAQERAGSFDFKLKPATGPHAKEAMKDDFMQLFALAMQLPMIQQNAWAQWKLCCKLFKTFGIDFGGMIPEPQKPEMSKPPNDEWLLMLQGEDVHVSPLDDDAMHLERHKLQLRKEHESPEPDVDAMNLLVDHLGEHEQQQQMKAEAQAAWQAIYGAMQAKIGQIHAGDAAGAKGGDMPPNPLDAMVTGGQPGLGTMGAQGAPSQGPVGGIQ